MTTVMAASVLRFPPFVRIDVRVSPRPRSARSSAKNDDRSSARTFHERTANAEERDWPATTANKPRTRRAVLSGLSLHLV